VLLEIGATTHDETVEHPDPPSARNQTVNQMAADETGAARHQIQRNSLVPVLLSLSLLQCT
jgi:hypothetical protein